MVLCVLEEGQSHLPSSCSQLQQNQMCAMRHLACPRLISGIIVHGQLPSCTPQHHPETYRNQYCSFLSVSDIITMWPTLVSTCPLVDGLVSVNVDVFVLYGHLISKK